MKNKVIWLEGMALKPQHFQQQERYLEALIEERTQLLGTPYFWGFQELLIDHALLAHQQFGLKKAVGIMPDGTGFNIPSTACQPESIHIPSDSTGKIIYLTLPIRRHNSAEINLSNVINKTANSDCHYRYQVQEESINDNIAAHPISTDIKTGILACQFVISDNPPSDSINLAIARIQSVEADQTAVLDPNFIPPCLNISASSKLSDYIVEISGAIQQRVTPLKQRLAGTDFGTTSEILDLSVLQQLNGAFQVLEHWQTRPNLHPEMLYLHWIDLLNYITLITQRSAQATQKLRYQHRDLTQTFQLLTQLLKNNLSNLGCRQAQQVPLTDSTGMWIAELTPEQLDNKKLTIAIYSDNGSESLRQHIPEQLKIAPCAQLPTLISKALSGIPIKSLSTAPQHVPSKSEFCYFAVDQKHEHWQAFSDSNPLALQLQGSFPGLQLELWLTAI